MDEDSLLAANAAYYRAFAARDLAAMEAIWAEEGVTCVHPGWPALIGCAPVVASYRDIFRNPSQETVTAREERALIEGEDGRVFCVEEVGGGLLLATNWFRMIAGKWRLLHHQASPLAPPPTAHKDVKRVLH
ncbi:nuclear transport factor 2 family protein [Methylocystis sp. JAN1]|uniref:nuclear transport factor 2 family protein n=1 Tax=Methylocystis sp. JAN1 TaxID=3397211 RepID=UPI003FA2C185